MDDLQSVVSGESQLELLIKEKIKNQKYSYKSSPEHTWIKSFLGERFTHNEIRAVCSCLASLYELEFQREYYRTKRGCFFWIHENASILCAQRKNVTIVFNDGTNVIMPPFTVE